MVTLFYIWGAINALLILFTIKTINYKLISNGKGSVDTSKVEKLNQKNFLKFNIFIIWIMIGLFQHSMIYFIFYMALIFILRIVHRKYNWVSNPTRFNINLTKAIRILHFILILIPVINHFFLHINITEKFYALFQ